MLLIRVAALIAVLPLAAQAAPTWQTVSVEQGKRIELDRTSIKREDGGKVTATARIVLDRELPDARSGASYRIIEATTVYDCASRNGATVKRVFKKNESEALREEEQKPVELPVRSGTLDDKVLREVCRPGKGDFREVVRKANEAAVQVRAANESGGKAEPAAASRTAQPLKAAVAVGGAATAEGAARRQPMPQRSARAIDAATVGRAFEAVLQHADIHWAYDGEGGPENWGRLDPANGLCANGQRQSPIDIRDSIKVDLEPIRFDYRPSLFRIVDNGHTVQVEVGEGSLTITGKTYDLVQFHFHKPSEEKIDGHRFDMVAHLVHKADDGRLAVVAVLMERGTENPFVQTLWNYLPLERQMEVSPPEATIDINKLLPADRNYITYMGSLTTPPCSEGVLWLVMRQPVPVSSEQLGIFARLYKNNARPIQPSFGRLIKEGR